MSKNIKLHTSCRTLPIFSFFEILETGDFRYLVKGYFGDNDKIKPIKNTEPFVKIFKVILKEYNSLIANKKEIKTIKKELLIAECEFKYIGSTKILDLYKETDSFEVLLLLKEFGFRINTETAIGPQISKITGLLTGLKMKIKIQKANYNFETKKKEEKVKNKISLDEEAMYLQVNLNYPTLIDTRKTTCERWANLKKLEEKKSKILEKQKSQLNKK